MTVRRTWVGVASSSRAYTDARCPSAADWMVEWTDSQDNKGNNNDNNNDALLLSGPPPPLRLHPLHGPVETEGGDDERLAALPGGRHDAGRSGKDGEDPKDGGKVREEDPFALIAAGIESLVSGFASQAWKKTAAFLAWSSTSFLKTLLNFFVEREKIGCVNDEPLGKGNNHGKAPIKDPHNKTMENRSPACGLNQQTMLDPNVGPNVSIDVRN